MECSFSSYIICKHGIFHLKGKKHDHVYRSPSYKCTTFLSDSVGEKPGDMSVLQKQNCIGNCVPFCDYIFMHVYVCIYPHTKV